ncbi:unnamed protein product, partial [Arctogadus glacialis]
MARLLRATKSLLGKLELQFFRSALSTLGSLLERALDCANSLDSGTPVTDHLGSCTGGSGLVFGEPLQPSRAARVHPIPACASDAIPGRAQ